MLLVALLLFDLFGLQVERIPDVTQDGIDELVVTDPRGDIVKERKGRILIVDPTHWAIVQELNEGVDESFLGGSISVARALSSSYIAGVVHRGPEHGNRVFLLASPSFERLWIDDEMDCDRRLSTHGLDIVCVAGPEGASVFTLECSRPIEMRPTRFRLLRRSFEGLAVELEFDARVPNRGGQILFPHFSEFGDLDGFFAAAIDGRRPFGRMTVSKGDSQISWLDLKTREFCPITPVYDGRADAGISIVLGRSGVDRLACDAVAVRRRAEGGDLLLLSKTAVTSSPEVCEYDAAWPAQWYWGAGLCWIPDVDGDGRRDLAVGCPEPFDGELQIVGSSRGALFHRVTPPPDGCDPTLPERWTYAPNFGTALCLIPDQDGDGQDDLAVSATTWGGCGAYPAGISIVSTKTWKLFRVVFERDLLRPQSSR